MRDKPILRAADPPPPAIGSDRVIAYAIVDKTVHFTGEQRLFVGDKLLGRVPRIAIGKSLQKELKDYLILFCSKSWRALGVAGAQSLPLAKKQVERYYAGISDKWVTVNTSEKIAKRWRPRNTRRMSTASAVGSPIRSR